MRKNFRLILTLLAGVALLGIGFGAGYFAIGGTKDSAETTGTPITATVRTDTVGQSLTLVTTARSELAPVASNTKVGTLTALATTQDISNGDALYWVDAQPVAVIKGNTPQYRDLSSGSKGEDVREIQAMLIERGLLEGEPTGAYSTSTTRAVRAWQERIGAKETGSIQHGDIVSISGSDLRPAFDAKIMRKGALLQGGELGVLAPVGEPSFVMVLTEAQSRLIPDSATMKVQFEDLAWEAVVASRAQGDSGIELNLTAPGGGPVCAKECSTLASGEDLSLLTTVSIVPKVTGPTVPVAAITVNSSGQSVVHRINGDETEEVPVQVLGSQDGVAVVEGLSDGDVVSLPQESGTGSTVATPSDGGGQ